MSIFNVDILLLFSIVFSDPEFNLCFFFMYHLFLFLLIFYFFILNNTLKK